MGIGALARRSRPAQAPRRARGRAFSRRAWRRRGPGQFFGSLQHGLGDLKIANVLRDTDILLRARQAAVETLDAEADCRYVREVLRLQYKRRFAKINEA